ncbi:hypothetical protein GCM10007422_17370 [Pedobacter zeae]|uniref:Uncharacterized protein n=2 Tax=Pedobacter zeae TaxID=1737356 RepID=A0ABQ1XTU9_9SPHI|nr:hypothetical protein GCM10007422_17370 [Pedobacter zeae]
MYQECEDIGADPGSESQTELVAIGLNSLWGIIGGIRKEFHLSHNEIMWKRSWTNITMMMADQSRMVKKKKQPVVTTGAEMAARFAAKNNG